ncbi:putative zinc-binding metallopeptidase [Micropruina sp.]|uniref:zinc-binding metallopeptidase family protein n=1 Tax=Micropruina sp. TaxID=2737536 RepID=UPI0039E3B5B5
MPILQCLQCSSALWLESLECPTCSTPVMFDPNGFRPLPLTATTHRPCDQREWKCNWAVPSGSSAMSCYSCRLTRRSPHPDDLVARAKLASTGQSKRRLLRDLATLGLPVVPHWVREGGLAFDLLSSKSPGQGSVIIGHANGVITINLAESLDDYRESMRIRLDEPYRTMLGHFRHEVGHYYQWQLVEAPGGELLDRCRALFGDETASYRDAIDRHYKQGAPGDWAESYISSYATMHPWEDFAETFAHYLHIQATLTIVAAGGLELNPERTALLDHEVTPRMSYADAPFSEALDDWQWVSHLLNRANHAVGKGDLYPFHIPVPVARKLEFIHQVVRASRVDQPFVGVND